MWLRSMSATVLRHDKTDPERLLEAHGEFAQAHRCSSFMSMTNLKEGQEAGYLLLVARGRPHPDYPTGPCFYLRGASMLQEGRKTLRLKTEGFGEHVSDCPS